MGWLRPVPTARIAAALVVGIALSGAGLSVQSRGAPSAAPSFSAATLDSYQRGTPLDILTPLSSSDLWTRIKDLRRVAPGWITQGGAQSESRRRLAVATYTLELASFHANIVWQYPLNVYDLVEWACDLMRQGSRSPAERLWDLTSISLLERVNGTPVTNSVQTTGLIRVDPARMPSNADLEFLAAPVAIPRGTGPQFIAHLKHLQQRFPEETRWVLARAVIDDQATFPQPRGAVLTKMMTEGPEARLREAVALPDVAQEARVRLAYLKLRSNRIEDALTDLDAAGSPADRSVRYWLNLFRGGALERLKRPADALVAYQAAFETVPFAQSATVALATSLATSRRPAEAAQLIERMATARPALLDPWWLYPLPEYRFWPERLAQLRREMAP